MVSRSTLNYRCLKITMINGRPSLLVAPNPFYDESPISWILRVCQKHEISYPTLFRHFDLPLSYDPDLHFDVEHLINIARGTPVPEDHLHRLGKKYERIKRDRFLTTLLATSTRYGPRLRFCSLCLDTDPVPYFRTQWRFLDWEYCPTHRIKLTDRCSHCGRRWYGMSNEPKKTPNGQMQSIRDCPTCLYPLSPSKMPEADACASDTILAHQNHLVSAALNGHFYIDGIDEPVSCTFVIWYLRWYARWLRPDYIVEAASIRRRTSFLDIGDKLPVVLTMYGELHPGSVPRSCMLRKKITIPAGTNGASLHRG